MEGDHTAHGLSAVQVAFPQTPEEFESDPRVSFSLLDRKWLLEEDNGSEYEYDVLLKRWIPVLDDSLLAQQREAYAVPGVDESESARPQKKRKASYQNGDEGKGKKAKGNAEPRVRKNTAVYVTNLPDDATTEEVHSLFSKCGVVAEEIDGGKHRIKLYTDDSGKFKGDALIVYFRPESVDLAIQMLDDTDFRLGVSVSSGKMRVQAADFSYKSQQEAPAQSSVKDKKKIIRKTQRLNNKLADWDDDDPSVLSETNTRWDKVVILKHMFTLNELEEDPTAILDIKEDIREECQKLGEVTNVVLFDKEPDGVASVRFGNAQAARACVQAMDGRFFAGTRVEAYIADGSERFKKTNEKKASLDDEEDEEEERLDKFGSWLESGGAE
ncbi:hypothetical protein L228DRAFT_257748 [Xylona heveae TC161]|uniref:RRM domain-containing protein n=1 Tax=Xylona heveae (strain CBS 132557 / TC161) TaxID=1328760 RepID=A0A165JIC5_XYLHT|nr:hypothetical protein L228DRAFT_257748 [Xylona heveae TC161]KZF26277.1 hypothetical protein L228DRAFT_257748 [Xylona heveae TC161]